MLMGTDNFYPMPFTRATSGLLASVHSPFFPPSLLNDVALLSCLEHPLRRQSQIRKIRRNERISPPKELCLVHPLF